MKKPAAKKKGRCRIGRAGIKTWVREYNRLYSLGQHRDWWTRAVERAK